MEWLLSLLKKNFPRNIFTPTNGPLLLRRSAARLSYHTLRWAVHVASACYLEHHYQAYEPKAYSPLEGVRPSLGKVDFSGNL